jgi:tetratricopeptide (TPR) repeat protein
MPQSWISDRSAALKSALTGIGGALAYLTTTFEGANKALASIEKLGIPKDVAVLTVVVTLGVTSAYFLLQSISKRSKLLRPERFRLDAENPALLKGRDAEILDLARLCDSDPLVFLEGESGSGKSALVSAGLIPWLNAAVGRPLPIRCDLSGAAWNHGLDVLLTRALYRAVGEGRSTLGWSTPAQASAVFSELARVEPSLGRKPLLIFDQFDDYQQAHRNYFYHLDSGVLRDKAGLLANNSFWHAVAQGLESDTWHCLFVTRSDQRAGLDLVRFIDARTFSLYRVPRNRISPVLSEITLVASSESPVIADSDKGWTLLRERLLDDLKSRDQNEILPIELAIALQGLQDLPSLTVRDYVSNGGSLGLARQYVEREVHRAAQTTRLSSDNVLLAVAALADEERGGSRRLSSEVMFGLLLAPQKVSGASQTDRSRAQQCLERLRSNHLLRNGVDPGLTGEATADWLLYHDRLVSGVLQALRGRDRWRSELSRFAKQLRLAATLRERWQALLPISLQFRLAWERWRPKFSRKDGERRMLYGEYRRFALLSLIKPAIVVLLVSIPAAAWLYSRTDAYQVRQILTGNHQELHAFSISTTPASQLDEIQSISLIALLTLNRFEQLHHAAAQSPTLLVMLGAALEKMNRTQDARLIFQEAKTLALSNSPTRFYEDLDLTQAYSRIHHILEARQSLERLKARIAALDSSQLISLARVCNPLGDSDCANNALQRAAELAEALAVSGQTVAELIAVSQEYSQMHRDAQASSLLTLAQQKIKGIKDYAEQESNYRDLARALAEAGNVDAAILAASAEHIHDRVTRATSLAAIVEALVKIDAVNRALQVASEMNGYEDEAASSLSLIATHLADQNRLSDALSIVDKATPDPGFVSLTGRSGVLASLISHLASSGRVDQAIDLLTKMGSPAIESSEDRARVYLTIAVALRKKGRNLEATQMAARARRILNDTLVNSYIRLDVVTLTLCNIYADWGLYRDARELGATIQSSWRQWYAYQSILNAYAWRTRREQPIASELLLGNVPKLDER